MIKRFVVLAAPLAMLGACATPSPEARLRNGLIDAGLPPGVAGCMAERMADRLSVAQLRRLKTLAGLKDRRIEDMSIGEFLGRVRGLQDVELIEVTTRAGLGCALLG